MMDEMLVSYLKRKNSVKAALLYIYFVWSDLKKQKTKKKLLLKITPCSLKIQC